MRRRLADAESAAAVLAATQTTVPANHAIVLEVQVPAIELTPHKAGDSDLNDVELAVQKKIEPVNCRYIATDSPSAFESGEAVVLPLAVTGTAAATTQPEATLQATPLPVAPDSNTPPAWPDDCLSQGAEIANSDGAVFQLGLVDASTDAVSARHWHSQSLALAPPPLALPWAGNVAASSSLRPRTGASPHTITTAAVPVVAAITMAVHRVSQQAARTRWCTVAMAVQGVEGQLLGSGTYGAVHLATYNGERCAEKAACYKRPVVVATTPVPITAMQFHRPGAGQKWPILLRRQHHHADADAHRVKRVARADHESALRALRLELTVLELLHPCSTSISDGTCASATGGGGNTGSRVRVLASDCLPVANSVMCDAVNSASVAQHAHRRVIDHVLHTGVVQYVSMRMVESDPRIILRLYDSDLRTLLLQDGSDDHDNLSPLQRAILAYDICSGMVDLHVQGYIHRDLKRNNVLVLYDCTLHCWRAVVADFGCAEAVPRRKYLHEESTDFLERIPEYKRVVDREKARLAKSVPDLLEVYATGKRRHALAPKTAHHCFTDATIVVDKPSDVFTFGTLILVHLFDSHFYTALQVVTAGSPELDNGRSLAEQSVARCVDTDEVMRITFVDLKSLLAQIVNKLCSSAC